MSYQLNSKISMLFLSTSLAIAGGGTPTYEGDDLKPMTSPMSVAPEIEKESSPFMTTPSLQDEELVKRNQALTNATDIFAANKQRKQDTLTCMDTMLNNIRSNLQQFTKIDPNTWSSNRELINITSAGAPIFYERQESQAIRGSVGKFLKKKLPQTTHVTIDTQDVAIRLLEDVAQTYKNTLS